MKRVLDVEMEGELVDEVPVCTGTEEVIGKLAVVTAERVLLVSELREARMGQAAREKEFVAFHSTYDFYYHCIYRCV